MPEPFFKNTGSVKINLKATELEALEEYGSRIGLTADEAARELIVKALDKMEVEAYSQVYLKEKYGKRN